MDPCPFVRLIVESLALKLPTVSKPAGHGVHPSTSPCFCVIQLQESTASRFQTVPLPLVSTESPPGTVSSAPVVFILDPVAINRLSGKLLCLTVSVYSGRAGTTCGFSAGRLLGQVRFGVELAPESAAVRPAVLKSGWVGVRSGRRSAERLHLVVRSEPDPRFVFQFGGEPECSPVVFQIGGGFSAYSGCRRQPAFSCRFSADRRAPIGSRSFPPKSSNRRLLVPKFIGKRSFHWGQRKGWTVTIHDLCGSPVAAASMITPFVPSPGSNRVSRANPGAWLILRPAGSSSSNWKPWGRLEAWRERGPYEALGYHFELMLESGPTASVAVAESYINLSKGGEFRIDDAAANGGGGGGDACSGTGFVMRATVEGEGRVSRPEVQVGAQHVVCMADAALFVALAAAVDLSVDACQLFSRKLRKELRQELQDYNKS
ncbi:hypothetical protein HPP92_022678 [Vanilla planifolia]|uniref:Uncharacterized protein n=1 Tax=Vanilla planifolia TaxID=51239 RepID=A0A835UFW8_VANPL|nr:hypothetical protein HPP92_022678 [Vanilla planifolia]